MKIKEILDKNRLSISRPDLAAEWNYEKNGDVTPDMVSKNSQDKYWWKGKCGHEWQSSVICRVNSAGKCPYCTGQKVLKGFNDLETRYPDLAKEWHPTKNGDLTPSDIFPNSNKKYWWLGKCGHEWETAPNSRISHRGKKATNCPYCSGQRLLEGFNDFATVCPDLVKQWNYEKNGEMLPNKVIAGSPKKIWWKCEICGYEWQTKAYSRKINNSGCPVCSNKKTMEGVNDLLTLFPSLIKNEWDYEKNIIDPSQIGTSSPKKVWWKCEFGHSYEQRIGNKTSGSGCPICSQENHTSFAEQAIYYYVKQYFSDAINGDRKILNGKELDIFIPSLNVAIEYDGVYWHSSERDIDKSKLCKEKKIKLIHVREKGLKEIDGDINYFVPNVKDYCAINQVIARILNEIGINNKIIDTESNRITIMQEYVKQRKEMSFASIHPDLVKYWDAEKNKSLTPDMFLEHSTAKVYWICERGHSWQAEINALSNGHCCPYCSGQKIFQGYNDIETLSPQLAAEWHPTKNGNTLPNQVGKSDKRKFWWLGECGHEWQQSIHSRTAGAGCPICINFQVLPGDNDLATKYPKLEAEWHPTKNGDLKPNDVIAGGAKIVWWKCKEGHEWQARISDRVFKNSGCPYCNGKLLTGYNDLATLCPKLAEEWHPTKNGKLKPCDITLGDRKRVWWLGKCGHEWQATTNDRVGNSNKKGSNCPYCSNQKLLTGFNDLQTTNPKLAAEWHPTKNGDVTPYNVHEGSSQKVWWMCKNGHEWQAGIVHRKNGNNCPICSGKKILKGYNDLATLYPELCKEWHPSLNTSVDPSMVTSKSGVKVWWLCNKCGHEWKSAVYNRTNGAGCPNCYRNHRGNQVINLDTGDIYNSCKDAAESIGVAPTQISACCKGKTKSSGGFRWSYYTK